MLKEAVLAPGGFGAVLSPANLDALIGDEPGRAELQALLDERLVLHIKPRAQLTRESVGRLGYLLGYPRDPAARPAARAGAPAGPAGEFSFVADFGARADLRPPSGRPGAYIDRLHQDGISGYSIGVTFDASPLEPQRFVDLRAVLRDLPPALKRIAERGHALHASMATPRTLYAELPAFDPAAASRRPLAVKHFRTGEALLHPPRNPASRIEGMDEAGSRAFLEALWTEIEASPHTLRVNPAHNELVVWDGMATLHTNPSYPRDRDRGFWFFIIPTRQRATEPAFA